MTAAGRIAFWGILALQIAVPAFQLRAERPARFGWQMFTGLGQPGSFDLVLDDGSIDRVRAAEVLVRWRPEIDTGAPVPRLLCERFPDAVAVRRYPVGRDGPPHETPCR